MWQRSSGLPRWVAGMGPVGLGWVGPDYKYSYGAVSVVGRLAACKAVYVTGGPGGRCNRLGSRSKEWFHPTAAHQDASRCVYCCGFSVLSELFLLSSFFFSTVECFVYAPLCFMFVSLPRVVVCPICDCWPPCNRKQENASHMYCCLFCDDKNMCLFVRVLP